MQKEFGRKPRILVIDDNQGDVTLFRWALKQVDFECELTVIVDGGAALDFVRKQSQRPDSDVPDLVVLDLNLPKADGREILEAMRATDTFANVPVVVWTSSNTPRDREQLNALRIDRYIVKPAELDEFAKLGGVIKQLLAHPA